MAKNKVEVDVVVDDKGTTKKVGMEAKKASKNVDKLSKSASTADRNMKGASKQSSNSTKNFSKMAQGTGGLVGVYATLAAQIFAVSAAFQFLKSASEVRNLIAGQEALGAVSGIAYKTITQGLREATAGQLTYAEAAKAAAIGTASGLSPDQLNRLGSAAKNASAALGRDLTDSFNRLIRGVTKAEPELLDELGIVLRLETANREYAESIGKTVSQLSIFEKSQAVANNVLEQAETKFGAIEKVMDPGAHALNQFLVSFDSVINSIKVGAIDTLRPVFEFLTKNTYSLIAALSLVALPIVKSILPNFGEWQDKARETLKEQKKDLKKYNKAIDKTSKKIEKLSNAENRGAIFATGQSTIKDLGLSTDKSASGKGGLDFILGNTNEKTAAAAKANAEKILKAAEKQFEDSEIVKTGKLKGATREQFNIIKSSYKQRVAVYEGDVAIHNAAEKKKTLETKRSSAERSARMTEFKAKVTRASESIAVGFSKVLSILGWIGVITTVGLAFFEMAKSILPVNKALEEANKEIEVFTNKTELLNKELESMGKAQHLLGAQERVVQLGQAMTSSGLLVKISEYNRLSREGNTDNLIDAREGLVKTLKLLGKLNPEITKFAEQIASLGAKEKITGNLVTELGIVDEKSRKAAKAFTAFAQQVKDLNTARDNLIDSSQLITNPLQPFLNQLTNTNNLNKDRLEGLKDQVKILNDQKTLKAQELKDQKALIASQKSSAEFHRGFIQAGFAADPSALINEADGWVDIEKLENSLPKLKQELEDITKSWSESDKLYKSISRSHDDLLIDISHYKEISKDVADNFNSISKLNIDAAKMQRVGITLEGKRVNLLTKEKQAKAAALKAQNQVWIAQKAADSAKEKHDQKQSDASQLVLDNANNQLVAVTSLREVADSKLLLTKLTNDVTRENLKLEERTLKIKRLQAAVDKRRFDLNIKSIRSNAFQQGSSRERGFVSRKLVTDGLVIGIQDASLALQELRDKENTVFSNALDASQDINQAQLAAQGARLAVEEQESLVAKLTEEFHIRQDILKVIQRESDTKLSDARETAGAFSLSPIRRAQNEAVLEEERRSGVRLDSKTKEKIMENAKAMGVLNFQMELTNDLSSSLQDNMTSAFTSIIDGTQSAKEAFKSMAISILQDLANMIAKALVFKALNAAFGGTDIGNFLGLGGTTTPSKRYGGIVEQYSTGGIARGRSAGYGAILHGTEAVVPLPDGKNIPVVMNKNSDSSNVVVNVNIDGNGNSQQNQQSDSSQGANLGAAIAKAVQQELQNQKRSGGILSPYGVA